MHQWIPGSIKLLENFRLVAALDPDTAVGNFKLDDTIVAVKLNAQKLFFTGILQSIVHQVNKCACNCFTVQRNGRKVWVDLFFKREPLLLYLIAIRVERVSHQFGDVGFAKLILFVTSLDARKVEDVINQSAESFALLANDAEIMLYLNRRVDAPQLERLSIKSN